MKLKKTWVKKIILLVVAAAMVAAYFFVPGIHSTVLKIFKMFASGDFTVVKEFVASYGAYAAVISFVLMIFQSVAAPLPAFLLTFANANLFRVRFFRGAVQWQERQCVFSLQEFWVEMWQRS